MGWRVMVDLELVYPEDQTRVKETIQKVAGYGAEMWTEWLSWGDDRQQDMIVVTDHFPGMRLTLNCEDSTGHKWTEVYADGELVSEDEMEEVEQSKIAELRSAWQEFRQDESISRLQKAIEAITG